MTLYSFIEFIFRAIELLILIRVILSWIPHDPYNTLIQWIMRLTDPLLIPLQGIVPPSKLGGIDISPIIALFLLSLLNHAIVSLLFP